MRAIKKKRIIAASSATFPITDRRSAAPHPKQSPFGSNNCSFPRELRSTEIDLFELGVTAPAFSYLREIETGIERRGPEQRQLEPRHRMATTREVAPACLLTGLSIAAVSCRRLSRMAATRCQVSQDLARRRRLTI